MSSTSTAHFVGSGIGSLVAAASLTRDGAMVGLTSASWTPARSGAPAGTALAMRSAAIRCAADACRRPTTTSATGSVQEIPLSVQTGHSVSDETLEFNQKHVSNATARLVDSRRAKLLAAPRGSLMQYLVESRGRHNFRSCS